MAYKQNFKLLSEFELDWDEIELQFEGIVELLMSQTDDQELSIQKMKA